MYKVIFFKTSEGIWPNSSSFQEDLNIGPIPSTWKGKCVSGENFDPKKSCNRKVIGARYYVKGIENEYGELNTTKFEYRSPLDFLGHGTHTSSTAVGSIVNNASFLGLGEGTARGGAPRARLAMYKVCWGDENYNGRCTDADIMAAFDDALNDGVNVISVSIGSPLPLAPFYESVADIGSFHAMQLGVSVVFSGGNDGPDLSLVRNVNPWSLCVAASTIDRTFPTRITLDNKLSFMGEGLLTKSISGKFVGAEPYFNGGVCRTENRKNRSAKGRIFLCMSSMGGVTSGEAQIAVRNISGTGLIFVDILSHQIPDVDILPTVLVDLIQGTQIANYLLDAFLTPKVVISASRTTTEVSQAPVVAYFSSRGPSSLSPDILKPDVSAPGVNILAAWPPKTPPTLLPFDINRSTSWNFQSGTSMSCPHVTGVVALIKSAHPHWSPAAIKSAIMTTAYRKDNSEDTILSGGSMKASDPFDIGSGHIDPLKALDPGLIYDLNTNDYILYLCNLGYAQDQINQMLSCPITTNCPKSHTNTNINYPSITISDLQSTMTIKRTVRNVGHKKTAFYFVKVISPNGVEVVVWPRILIFTCFKEEASYHVSFKPVKRSHGRYDFGEIVWSDGFHFVRSPLVVFVNTTYNGGAAPVLDTFSSGDPESI